MNAAFNASIGMHAEEAFFDGEIALDMQGTFAPRTHPLQHYMAMREVYDNRYNSHSIDIFCHSLRLLTARLFHDAYSYGLRRKMRQPSTSHEIYHGLRLSRIWYGFVIISNNTTSNIDPTFPSLGVTQQRRTNRTNRNGYTNLQIRPSSMYTIVFINTTLSFAVSNAGHQTRYITPTS